MTCADDAVYEDQLIPFLGSLISLARWDGQIAVFDYGLSARRVARLKELGINVERVRHRHFVTLDRFLHLARFAEKKRGMIGQWDADVWFTSSIAELVDTYRERHGRRLVCNLDCVFQTSCYAVAHTDQCLQRVKGVLEPIIQTHGNVLQCGFIFGHSTVVAACCRYVEGLIKQGEYAPEWTGDTVGLNYFFSRYPTRVALIDPRYNCTPDWFPRRRGRGFYLNGQPMRALHVTSPWRADASGDSYRFQTVHKELYGRWRERLDA